MPLQVRTGTAFLWRPTYLHGEAADVVRVLDESGVTLGLLANGYECGFSTCWPPASRLVLDLFVDAWRGASGPLRERLLGAFAVACERFTAQAPALITSDADLFDDLPRAVLLAVGIEGTTAHVAWIGGDVAIVARDAKAIVETTPHSLVERLRREHPEVVDLSAVPNVIARTIGPKAPDAEPPDYLATELVTGDTLVLLSRSAFRGPCVPVADAAVVAARITNPSALAEQLARLGFSNDAAYAAVAVLRVEPAA